MLIGTVIIMKEKQINGNYRQSLQRDRMLEILRGTDTHPTADWLYSQLKTEFPKLSPGTVYRNLGILQQMGKIKRIQYGSTFDRYEANLSNHYHFICENCNSITDITIPACEEILKNADELSDLSINYHQIEFYGICSSCRKNG